MMPSPLAFKHYSSVSRVNMFIYKVKHAGWKTKHSDLFLPIHLYFLFHISFLVMSMAADKIGWIVLVGSGYTPDQSSRAQG